jgi:hypothetical protein
MPRGLGANEAGAGSWRSPVVEGSRQRLPFERRVPVVLDGVVGAALQHAGDGCPSVRVRGQFLGLAAERCMPGGPEGAEVPRKTRGGAERGGVVRRGAGVSRRAGKALREVAAAAAATAEGAREVRTAERGAV